MRTPKKHKRASRIIPYFLFFSNGKWKVRRGCTDETTEAMLTHGRKEAEIASKQVIHVILSCQCLLNEPDFRVI